MPNNKTNPPEEQAIESLPDDEPVTRALHHLARSASLDVYELQDEIEAGQEVINKLSQNKQNEN